VIDWSTVRNFHQSEFDSPDYPGSGSMMQLDLVETLDTLRDYCGFPFYVTSGFRTLAYNAQVGGELNSAHLRGWAADLYINSSSERYALISAAIELGIFRIGIGSTFIHIDCDPSLPQNVIWTYPS
jgi:uncharacterized protein YcbK (DUF882 family)